MAKDKGLAAPIRHNLVKLFFTLHEPEEFYNTSHSKGHTVGILSVCNIKFHDIALAREKREVHLPGSHEI